MLKKPTHTHLTPHHFTKQLPTSAHTHVPSRRQFLKYLTVTSLAISTATLLPACQRTPTQHKLPKGSQVIALGDSLTYGYGADAQYAYPNVLAKLTHWQITNAGINGDTSQDVLNRLDDVIAKKPDLVLLGIGGNDVLQKVNPNTTKANIIQIIEQLQHHQIEVILIAEPHFSVSALFGKVSDNPIYAEIAKDKNILLFAKGWSNILSDKALRSDQIHANNQGYQKFANELYQFLQKNGYI